MNIVRQIKAEFKRGASAAKLHAKRMAKLKKDRTVRKKEALLLEKKRLAEKKEYMDLEDSVRAQRSNLRKRQLSKIRTNLSRNNKYEPWIIGRQNDNPWQTASNSKKKNTKYEPWIIGRQNDNPWQTASNSKTSNSKKKKSL